MMIEQKGHNTNWRFFFTKTNRLIFLIILFTYKHTPWEILLHYNQSLCQKDRYVISEKCELTLSYLLLVFQSCCLAKYVLYDCYRTSFNTHRQLQSVLTYIFQIQSHLYRISLSYLYLELYVSCLLFFSCHISIYTYIHSEKLAVFM